MEWIQLKLLFLQRNQIFPQIKDGSRILYNLLTRIGRCREIMTIIFKGSTELTNQIKYFNYKSHF